LAQNSSAAKMLRLGNIFGWFLPKFCCATRRIASRALKVAKQLMAAVGYQKRRDDVAAAIGGFRIKSNDGRIKCRAFAIGQLKII
jgi:hypothetical protein